MYLFIYSAYSGMFTIGPESFPTEIRGVGLAIAGMCARIAGITTPIVTGLVLEYQNGFEITIIMYSVSYIIAGVSILMLKETKLKVKQKTLG